MKNKHWEKLLDLKRSLDFEKNGSLMQGSPSVEETIVSTK